MLLHNHFILLQGTIKKINQKITEKKSEKQTWVCKDSLLALAVCEAKDLWKR